MDGLPQWKWDVDTTTGIPRLFPLTVLEHDFSPLIKHLSVTSIQKHMEKEFRKKLLPRNMRIGPVYAKAIQSRFIHPESADYIPDFEFIVRIVCDLLGYGRHISHTTPFAIKPPKQNSSAGLLWHKGKLRHTSKGANWLTYQRWASELIKLVQEDDFLDITRIYDAEYLQDVCERYHLAYVLGTRLDGGPSKARLIWQASGLMYLIESCYLGYKQGHSKKGLSRDVIESPHIATHSWKVFNYLEEFRGQSIQSRDASRWDLNWPWYYQVSALKILCLLYRVPIRIAVLIIAYNTAAPFLYRIQDDYYYVDHLGSQRSGTGVFVKVNHLLRAVCNYLVTSTFDKEVDLGVLLGDDTALATSASLSKAAELLFRKLNVIEKPGAQIVSKEGLTLCRRVFLHRYSYSLPVCWSLIRNTLFHENQIFNPYTLALSRRSQLENLVSAAQHNKAWYNFYERFIQLHPKDSYLFQLTEEDLMQRSDKSQVDKYYFNRSML